MSHYNGNGPEWYVDYAEIYRAIGYKMGALIIHACYGNDSNARLELLSVYGVYYGVHGVYEPGVPVVGHAVNPIAELWGDETEDGKRYYGGKQKTNKFEVD